MNEIDALFSELRITPEREDKQTEKKKYEGSREKILIVDDEEPWRYELKKLMEEIQIF